MDPKAKIGVWTILKDIIHKDLTKIGLPIYFNDPTTMLQRIGTSFEYKDILDMAATDPDPVRRVALIGIFQISSASNGVTSNKKPFNPILGETYEIFGKDYRFLAE